MTQPGIGDHEPTDSIRSTTGRRRASSALRLMLIAPLGHFRYAENAEFHSAPAPERIRVLSRGEGNGFRRAAIAAAPRSYQRICPVFPHGFVHGHNVLHGNPRLHVVRGVEDKSAALAKYPEPFTNLPAHFFHCPKR